MQTIKVATYIKNELFVIIFTMVLGIILMMLIIMIQIKGNGVLGAHAGSRQFIKKEQLLQQWEGNLLQLKRDLFGIIKGGFSDGASSIKGTNCVKL